MLKLLLHMLAVLFLPCDPALLTSEGINKLLNELLRLVLLYLPAASDTRRDEISPSILDWRRLWDSCLSRKDCALQCKLEEALVEENEEEDDSEEGEEEGEEEV